MLQREISVSGHEEEGRENTVGETEESKRVNRPLTQGVSDRVTEMSENTLVTVSLSTTYFLSDSEAKSFPNFRKLNQNIRHLSTAIEL